MNIELSQCPQIFQDAVNEYLSAHTEAKALAITSSELAKFDTVTYTTYKTYVENGNLFILFKYTECSDLIMSDYHVHQNHMIAGDIRKFVELSWWFNDYRKIEV